MLLRKAVTKEMKGGGVEKGVDLEASRMLKVRAVQSEVGVVEPNRAARLSRGWLQEGHR